MDSLDKQSGDVVPVRQQRLPQWGVGPPAQSMPRGEPLFGAQLLQKRGGGDPPVDAELQGGVTLSVAGRREDCTMLERYLHISLEKQFK